MSQDHITSTQPTICLANALRPEGDRVDVMITDGRVRAITAATAPDAPAAVNRDPTRIDLDGRLLLPAFAEPHAHLDKALTADRVLNPAGDLLGAIEAWDVAARQGAFDHDDVVGRAIEALGLLVKSGTTAVRSHVNVGAEIGVTHLRAVREAANQMSDLITVQLVALVAPPITGAAGAGNYDALVQALEAGADLVGGCPDLDTDPGAMLDLVLGLGLEAGRGLDLHVDETLDPSVRTLEMLARAVIDRGFDLPVTASHCVSLGVQTVEVQQQIAGLVAEAGITIVTLPQTNLYLQGRGHPTATPRGLTAIGALREAGATVIAGADNVEDPFNLLGRSDPLETAALMVLAGHRSPEEALAMVGADAHRVLIGEEPAVRVGARADFVALAASSIRGAIARAPSDRLVIRAGRVVARIAATEEVVRAGTGSSNRGR